MLIVKKHSTQLISSNILGQRSLVWSLNDESTDNATKIKSIRLVSAI